MRSISGNLIIEFVSLFRQIFTDLLWAVGSMVFVGVCMYIQTGSLWITGWVLFSIFMSFLEANVVYRVILDYKYEMNMKLLLSLVFE